MYKNTQNWYLSDDETPLLDTEINDTDVDIKEPKISINALTGVAGFRTMRVIDYHIRNQFMY